MSHSTLSEKLRALRKKSGYTQEDISRKLNIQRQTYCNYENDTRTPPLETVVALAEIYHVSVDYLVRDSAASSDSDTGRSSHEKKLLSEFSSLSFSKQKEVIEFIRFKKQLPD